MFDECHTFLGFFGGVAKRRDIRRECYEYDAKVLPHTNLTKYCEKHGQTTELCISREGMDKKKEIISLYDSNYIEISI